MLWFPPVSLSIPPDRSAVMAPDNPAGFCTNTLPVRTMVRIYLLIVPYSHCCGQSLRDLFPASFIGNTTDYNCFAFPQSSDDTIFHFCHFCIFTAPPELCSGRFIFYRQLCCDPSFYADPGSAQRSPAADRRLHCQTGSRQSSHGKHQNDHTLTFHLCPPVIHYFR